MALSNALGQLFRVSGQNVRVAGSKQVAALSSAVSKYELPDLSYDYGALEPHVSGQIMELHHDKHHRTYVNNLNAALEQYEAAEKAGNLDKMIELQNAIKFNGGGHLNHSIFWQNLSPNGGGEPTGELSERINTQWGSFENFKKEFNTKSTTVQGSGWCWLGYNQQKDRLEIAQCQNQDPLAMYGLVPLLGFDVWEHAFYLQYHNKKADYVQALWNVVNFDDLAKRLADAKSN